MPDASPARLLLIHGRGQAGRSEAELTRQWMTALGRGAMAAELALPPDPDVTLPFYGDRMDALALRAAAPGALGTAADADFEAFRVEMVTEMRTELGLAVPARPSPRGEGLPDPVTREWVQAILRAIERAHPGLSERFLETYIRDVYLYLTAPLVRREIDALVAAPLDARPTVVVGHSLGSVIAFAILRDRRAGPDVPLLMTLGSPLGIRTISRRLGPIHFPARAAAWINGFDQRDVIALRPVDATGFPVEPPIRNIDDIDNRTAGHHGIDGYLDKPQIAGPIVTALAG